MCRHFDDEEATATGARMHGWSLRRWAACPYVYTQFDVNTVDKNGETPLFSAVRRRLFGLAVFILNVRAYVNLVNAQGLRCLHVAAAHGDSMMIAKLVLESAQVNATVSLGHTGDSSVRITALHMAIYSGHFSACEALVLAGADPCIHPHASLTTLDLAIRCGNRDILGLVQHEFMIVNLDPSSPHYEAIKRALKLSMRILLQGPGQADLPMQYNEDDGDGDDNDDVDSQEGTGESHAGESAPPMSSGQVLSLLHKLYCHASKPWWDAEDTEAPIRTAGGLARSGTVSVKRYSAPEAEDASAVGTMAVVSSTSLETCGLGTSLSDKALDAIDLSNTLRVPQGNPSSQRRTSMPDPILVSDADKYKQAIPGWDTAVVDSDACGPNGHVAYGDRQDGAGDLDPNLSQGMSAAQPEGKDSAHSSPSAHGTSLYFAASGDTIEVREPRRLNSIAGSVDAVGSGALQWEDDPDDPNDALGITHPPSPGQQRSPGTARRSPGTARRAHSMGGPGFQPAQSRNRTPVLAAAVLSGGNRQDADNGVPMISQAWATGNSSPGMKLVRDGSQSSWTSATYSCDDNDWPDMDMGDDDDVNNKGTGKGSGMFVSSSFHSEGPEDAHMTVTPSDADLFAGDSWDRHSETSSHCEPAVHSPHLAHLDTSPRTLSKRPPRSPASNSSASPSGPSSARVRTNGVIIGRGARAVPMSGLCSVGEAGEGSDRSHDNNDDDNNHDGRDTRDTRGLRRYTDSTAMATGGKGSGRPDLPTQSVPSRRRLPRDPTGPASSPGHPGPVGVQGAPSSHSSVSQAVGTLRTSPGRPTPAAVVGMREKYRARVASEPHTPLGRGQRSTPVTPNGSRRSSFDTGPPVHKAVSQFTSPVLNPSPDSFLPHDAKTVTLGMTGSPRRLRARHSQDGFENSFVLPRPLEAPSTLAVHDDPASEDYSGSVDDQSRMMDALTQRLVGMD
eukprot:TRINITY_DN320_c0_g1_i2.p1 TRINITY_DN320_c0_g1~~TRINITY_DN320_c0_g1_i2.p1  ORF type:complete len:956 (-),score=111.43 TRINITY_DN320_c0_g1_i2:141-3008(-)